MRKLVRRRIQKIQLMPHYFVGFASIFPKRPDRSVWIDARDDRADENRTLTMDQAASPITVFGHRMSKK